MLKADDVFFTICYNIFVQGIKKMICKEENK